MGPDHDPYEALGVPVDATTEEIHRAYRRLLRQHHPDTRAPGGTDDEADAALQRILRSYALLRERRVPPAAGRPVQHRTASTSASLRATPVRWRPPAAAPPGTTSPGAISLVRWLLGQQDGDGSPERPTS